MKHTRLLGTLLLAGALSPAHAAVLADFNAGTLTITAQNEAQLVLSCAAGAVAVNGNTALLPGSVTCASVSTLNVNGDALDNLIDLGGLLPADFPILTGTTVLGAGGADSLTGSFTADTLTGGPGSDVVSGGGGDDVLIWLPGDGTDRNDGGDGNDRIVVQGGSGADPFFIGPNVPGGVFFGGLAQTGFSVLFVRDPGFSIAIRNAEVLEVNGNGGDDGIDAGALAAGLIALQLHGGDGNDTLVGSSGIDVITGGAGNDLVDANPGNDSIDLGDGDDVNVWNNGDNTDVVQGGTGNDRQIVNGAGAGDVMTVTAGVAPVQVRFDRTNLVPFGIDLTNVQTLEINGLGGDDNISASALPAGVIALELNGGDGNDTLIGSQGLDLLSGGPGNDVIDGRGNPAGTIENVRGDAGDDTLTWTPGGGDDRFFGGEGSDVTLIVGGAGAEVFVLREEPTGSGVVRFSRTTPGPFFVDSTETELLRVNANGGDDSVDSSTLANGLLLLELNGGDGNDTLIGSLGLDTLNGDGGDDILRAGPNPVGSVEPMSGGAGNDQLIWNPGDGDDLNEGGAGVDTLVVNGAGASEHFRISGTGARFVFARVLPTVFTLDNAGFELLQLNAGNGDDLVETQPLPGVQQMLDGGAQTTALADRLRVAGSSTVAQNSPILTPGFGAIEHANFESAESQRTGGSFSGLLDGQQEVPPVNTPALGRGSVLLNADESEIEVRLSYSGLSTPATLAHIHGPAAAGSNAPPIFDLSGVGGTAGQLGPFTFNVTPQQAADLKAGLWYFNVHTQQHPAGEIRGQIRVDRILDGPLSGAQVVPRAETQARGYVTARLDGAMDQVFFTLSYTGLTGEGVPGVSVDVAIFGPAPRGGNGPRIATITLPVSGLASDQIVAGPFPLSLTQAQQLATGRWYVQVASEEFPQGEIRGQITESLFFDSFE